MRLRVAFVTAIALVATVGVPPGAVPEGGGFPLSGLLSGLRPLPALADVVGVPLQESAGGAEGRGHYVPGKETRHDSAAGTAPGRGKGAVDATVPTPKTPRWTAPKHSGGDSFDERTSKRLPKQSSAQYDEFANADGSTTRRIYDTRINYRDANGAYQAIDPDLTPRRGRLAMSANSIEVSLATRSGVAVVDKGAKKAAAAVGEAAATGPLASMTTASGRTVSFDLAGAANVAAVVDGPTATYPEILPQTDVELKTFSVGLKETIVLKSADAAHEWVFPLRLDGLTPRLREDGSLAFLDSDGGVALLVPQGYMEDSKVDPRSGAPAQSSAVTYDLVTVGGSPALKVTADAAWLADPARQYPVRVDPSLKTRDTGDVFVDNDPDTTNHNGDNLPVGTRDGGDTVARSFIHFDEFDNDDLMGTQITAAKLHLFHTWSYDCSHHDPVYVRRIDESWSVASLTNNAGLAAGPAYSGAIGSLTIADNTRPATTVRPTVVWARGGWRRCRRARSTPGRRRSKATSG